MSLRDFFFLIFFFSFAGHCMRNDRHEDVTRIRTRSAEGKLGGQKRKEQKKRILKKRRCQRMEEEVRIKFKLTESARKKKGVWRYCIVLGSKKDIAMNLQ